MSLAKYKKPVEYSFRVWINSIIEDDEPVGQDYFLDFVKNAIRYHATTWMNPTKFKSRVRNALPYIEEDFLDNKWGQFETCLQLQKSRIFKANLHFENEVGKKGYYKEYSYSRGEFKEDFKVLPKI